MGSPLTRLPVFVWLSLAGCAACATTGQVPDRATRRRGHPRPTNQGIRVEGTAPLPPDAPSTMG